MKYSISIVSHRSGHLIRNLFEDLRTHLPAQSEIILTLNVPEDESYFSNTGLPLTVIRNLRPLGFGANHNQAFAIARGKYFVVVNPDIRLQDPPWEALADAFREDTGACAPSVYSSSSELEDSIRKYPTLLRLLSRTLLNRRFPDYPRHPQTPQAVDWAAGMFVMFDAQAFRSVEGFDTDYFMYLEDVDICRRLNEAGHSICWIPTCSVIHDAQRASRRNWQHRKWHLRSVVRYLSGI
jgi:N-acetylglucosaminyl-diphospho-decaprenol L-rhamnosyltransferase